MTTETILTGERADLIEALGKQRFFLRHTARDLSSESGPCTTPSASSGTPSA